MSQAAPALAPLADALLERQRDPASVVRRLAHELRQPLGTIEAIAFYLRMALPESDEKLRPHVAKLGEMVELSNWILADAVHYLLAAPANRQLVDVIEALSDELADQEGGDGSWVRSCVESERALVWIDPAQAQHLIRNVIEVAHRMMRPPEQVMTRAAIDGNWLAIEVEIPGVVFNRDQLDTLFEPFNGEITAGSGLALASARRIVETHGGTIGALARDGATVLEVRLPLEPRPV